MARRGRLGWAGLLVIVIVLVIVLVWCDLTAGCDGPGPGSPAGPRRPQSRSYTTPQVTSHESSQVERGGSRHEGSHAKRRVRVLLLRGGEGAAAGAMAMRGTHNAKRVVRAPVWCLGVARGPAACPPPRMRAPVYSGGYRSAGGGAKGPFPLSCERPLSADD